MISAAGNPECGWCGVTGTCHPADTEAPCNTASGLETGSCPGLCPALASCVECAAFDHCSWCVRLGQCLRTDEIAKDCNTLEAINPNITEPFECVMKDFQSGITVSRYSKSSTSLVYPDSSYIVNTSDVYLSTFDKRNKRPEVMFSLKGKIHPEFSPDKKVRHLQVCAAAGEGHLSLSSSPPDSPLVKVLNISHSSPHFKRTCETPTWPNGDLVYLFPPFAYNFDFFVNVDRSEISGFTDSRLTIQDGDTGHPLDVNNLEPWRMGNCSSYSHCKQCVEDNLCGWCFGQKSCKRRTDINDRCEQLPVTNSDQCEDCHDYIYCDTCLSDPACQWHMSEVTCARKGAGDVNSEVILAGAECPSPCHQRDSCASCLGEAGRCVWCHGSRECVLFSVFTSQHGRGECGPWSDLPLTSLTSAKRSGSLLESVCEPCSQHRTCSECHTELGCGWCEDRCTAAEQCVKNTAADAWQYFTCPDIDECWLEVDTCHPEATCVNTPRSYECHCRPGYQGDGRQCSRTCHPACGERGTCRAPDFTCQCDLGWTGATCNIDCGCHGHATCIGGVGQCDECQHNTAGETCQECSLGFVKSEEHCVSCMDYCLGHTNTCIQSEVNHTCSNCRNGTTGPRCDKCLPGTYRVSGSLRDQCVKCDCNGHGDTCDPITGGDCKCHNNTMTETSSHNSVNEECSKCEQYFIGDPRGGHHCYRAMMVNSDYCLDNENTVTQPDYCALHTEILPGRVSFFAVQPKFMNVHIRVNIDMLEGQVDIVLTSNSQLFIVQQNNTSQVHKIELDELKYGMALNIKDYVEHSLNLEHLLSEYPALIGKHNSYFSYYVNQNRSEHDLYNLRIKNASDQTTFVTLNSPYEVLLVKDVRHRLVVSIPDAAHDLRSSKFYILVYGARKQINSTTNIIGNLFFRQDQLHIDLFVFFSVFFSCFFLFLAFCVVIWKFKLTVDIRSARRRHVVEMTIMAQRPFARQLVLIDKEETEGCLRQLPPSSSPHPGRRKKKPWLNRGQVADTDMHQPGLQDLLLPEASDLTLTAISVEVTADNQAAVTSILIQMPGPGQQRSVQVGSVLTLTK